MIKHVAWKLGVVKGAVLLNPLLTLGLVAGGVWLLDRRDLRRFQELQNGQRQVSELEGRLEGLLRGLQEGQMPVVDSASSASPPPHASPSPPQSKPGPRAHILRQVVEENLHLRRTPDEGPLSFSQTGQTK